MNKVASIYNRRKSDHFRLAPNHEKMSSEKRYIEHPLFGRIELENDESSNQGNENTLRTEEKTGKMPDMLEINTSLPKLLQEMKLHKNECQAQEQGCQDLLKLVPNAEGEEYRRILSEMGAELEAMETAYNNIAKSGGISVTLAAMKAHKESSIVQETGCHILRLLSRTSENEEKISAAKGIEAMVEALKLHKNSASVQTSALRALWNFIFSDENKIRVHVGGGVLSTIEAMKANM